MRFKRIRRSIKAAVAGPPEGAHGQRNIDGTYFSVWLCGDGHGGIGSPDTPPEHACFACTFMTDNEPQAWRRATPEEATAYIFELEGFKMYDGVGFQMLT